jgi:hypothetical protein
VTAVAAGEVHSLALLSNGTVMAWGQGDAGQLGDGHTKRSLVPVPVSGLTNASAIAAGSQHALAVLTDGTIMAWGDNESGQLGDGGSESLSDVPVPVSSLTGVQSISAGAEHSLALLSTGTVMVWGDNGEFQLGQPNGFPGGIAQSNVPLTVPGVGTATAIAAGGSFSLAVVAGGKIMAWGDNSFGQLGNGTAVTGPAAVTVTGLSGVSQVAAGGAASFAFSPVAPVPDPAQGTASGVGIAGSAGPVSSPWRVTANPPDPGGAGGLKDVVFSSVSATSGSDAWAVGAFNALSSSQPLAEHWNGTSWAVVPSPNPQTGSLAVDLATPFPQDGSAPLNFLTGVAATGPASVWASGYEDNVNQQNFRKPYMLHWNGKAWALVNLPNLGSEGTLLASVTALSATDVWAAGQTQEGDGALLTLTEHFNGTSWSVAPSLDPGELGDTPDSTFDSITGVAPHTLLAVGTMETPTICCLQTLAEHSSAG